ncbi:MAG: DUF1186 domain-containing protein [Bacteroidota bacterium]
MYDRWRVFGYQITGNPEDADHRFHYSLEVQDVLAKFHQLIQRGNPKVLPRLVKAIKKYPRVPALRNYLTVYYHNQGNTNKAYDINRQIAEKFPGYLMARVNLAMEYLSREAYNKVPEVLGDELDLQALYPNRKVFHYGEFQAINNAAVPYFLQTKQYEVLRTRLPILTEVLGEDHPLVDMARDGLMLARRGQMDSLFEERSFDETLIREEAPVFTHPEVAQLYELPLPQAKPVYQQLLSLPADSLGQDLLALLKDSLHRYYYWLDRMKQEDRIFDFYLHAIYLLRELQPPGTLELFLEILRQGEDYLKNLYEDFVTEEWWRFVYPLVGEDLSVLTAFIKEKNIYTFSKMVAIDVLTQIFFHQIERKAEVVEEMRGIMQYMLDHKDQKEDICDPSFCAMLTVVVVGLSDDGLMQLSKQFYDLELCNSYFDFGYAEREKEYAEFKGSDRNKRVLPLPLFEELDRVLQRYDWED